MSKRSVSPARQKIWRRNATDLGPVDRRRGADPSTIAFLDPPYHKDLAAAALASLRDGGGLRLMRWPSGNVQGRRGALPEGYLSEIASMAKTRIAI